MADDGMDPCECMWSHEFAMRRLLSLLRQSQTVCTDSECFDEMPRMPGQQNMFTDNMMFMAMLYLLFTLFMFMLRPRSLRNNKSDADFRNNEGEDRRPPSPPAVN